MKLTIPEWLLCRECNKSRKHKPLFVHEVPIYDYDGQTGVTIYGLVQCQGCETVGFAVVGYDQDRSYVDHDGDHEFLPDIDLFPKAVAGRPQISDLHYMPARVRLIYQETHTALCNESSILTAIGIRATLEAVCKEELEFSGTLKQHVDALQKDGLLSKAGAEILQTIRDIGNGAAHEAKPHKLKDLATAFEVIDHLLMGLYVLPGKAGTLPKSEVKKKEASKGLRLD